MEIKRLYDDMGEQGSRENLVKILETIAPYVVVTGDYACGRQTELAAVDLFIRTLPPSEIVKKQLPEITENTYLYALMRFVQSMGYKWESRFFNSFSVDGTYLPLRFSENYNLIGERFEVEVLGVKMTASISDNKYI